MPRPDCLTVVAVLCFALFLAVRTSTGQSVPAGAPKTTPAQPVPFKLAKPNKPLIVLETVVNGEGPYRFVLDTGASLTMISPELAKKLDVKPEKSEKAVGAGGRLEIHFGTVKSLKIGETQLAGTKIGIMDLTGIRKATETEIDGIIGYNVLKNFRVVIDYPKGTVAFE
jgi:predicted aspartyl protease